MSSETTMVHVRVDEDLKSRATEALAGVGLTLSDAVRVFLTRVAAEGGLPAGLASDPETYDSWFRQKVHEALQDQRPTLTHEEAMQQAQALIDEKRRRSGA